MSEPGRVGAGPADTSPATELALRALGDHHSFLKRAGEQHGVTPGGFEPKYTAGTLARVYPGSPAAAARAGRVCTAEIEPDEWVPTPWAGYLGASGPVIAAALAWLQLQLTSP